jgi:hypothetical protein
MNLEGDVASGPVLDLAAVGERIERVLLIAFALEPVEVVFCYLLLEQRHEAIRDSGYQIFTAVCTGSCQFTFVCYYIVLTTYTS